MKKASQMVPCPFNPKHRLLQCRLLYHIYKCPDIVSLISLIRQLELKKSGSLFHCKYSWVHIFKTQDERDTHQQDCPDQLQMAVSKPNSDGSRPQLSSWKREERKKEEEREEEEEDLYEVKISNSWNQKPKAESEEQPGEKEESKDATEEEQS